MDKLKKVFASMQQEIQTHDANQAAAVTARAALSALATVNCSLGCVWSSTAKDVDELSKLIRCILDNRGRAWQASTRDHSGGPVT